MAVAARCGSRVARGAASRAQPGGRGLAAIAAGSGRKLWWRCSGCGHEWQVTVGSRASGHGCPACAHRRARGPRQVPAERSLTGMHPALLPNGTRSETRGLTRRGSARTPSTRRGGGARAAAIGGGHRWSIGPPVMAVPCALERRARTQTRVPCGPVFGRSRPGSRQRASPVAEPRQGSRTVGSPLQPEAVVAVLDLRPRVGGRGR